MGFRQKVYAATAHLANEPAELFFSGPAGPYTNHIIEAQYCYPDIAQTPLTNIPYCLTHCDSLDTYAGVTDLQGRLSHQVKLPGNYKLAFIPTRDRLAERELDKLHQALSQALNDIILNEQQAVRNRSYKPEAGIEVCLQQNYLGTYLKHQQLVLQEHTGASCFQDYQQKIGDLFDHMDMGPGNIWPDFALETLDSLEEKLFNQQNAQRFFATNAQCLNRLNLMLRDDHLLTLLKRFPQRYWEIIETADPGYPFAPLGLDLILYIISRALDQHSDIQQPDIPVIAAQSRQLVRAAVDVTANAIDLLQRIKPRKAVTLVVNQRQQCFANPLTTPQLAINHCASSWDIGCLENGAAAPESYIPLDSQRSLHVVSGDLLLNKTDFEIQGFLPISWSRHYCSGNKTDNGLGIGWSFSFSEALWKEGEMFFYRNSQGRIISMPIPAMGEFTANQVEKIFLHHEDSQHYVIKQSGLADRVFIYHKGFKLCSIRDHYNNQWSCRYRQGKLTEVVSSWGTQLQFIRQQGRIIRVDLVNTDRVRINLVRYEYQNSFLGNVIPMNGCQENYGYQHGILISDTSTAAADYQYHWRRQRCIKVSSRHGDQYVELNWNTQHRETTVLGKEGSQQRFFYNPEGIVTKKRSANGNETRFSYDNARQLSRVTTHMGHQFHYYYDPWGNLTTYNDPMGGGFSVTYNDRQLVTAFCDAQGHCWEVDYNEQDLISAVKTPYGATLQYQYNKQGLPVCQTNDADQTVHFTWNHAGQLTSITTQHNDNKSTSSRYYERDSQQRITAIMEQDDWLKIIYHHHRIRELCGSEIRSLAVVRNQAGLPVRIQREDGHQFSFDYDDQNQIIAYYVDNRPLIWLGYKNESLVNCPEFIADCNGGQYWLNYNKQRQLTHIVEAGGDEYQLKYSEEGYLCQTDYHSKSQSGTKSLSSKFYHDPMGKLLQKTDTKGDVYNYLYNGNGQLLAIYSNICSVELNYNECGELLGNRQEIIKAIESYFFPIEMKEKSLLNDVILLWIFYNTQQSAAGNLIEYPYKKQLQNIIQPTLLGGSETTSAPSNRQLLCYLYYGEPKDNDCNESFQSKLFHALLKDQIKTAEAR